MRTETVTRTIAKFDELTPEQQKKVIENNRSINTDDLEWWEFTIEDRTTILEMLGFIDVKIEFSGFSCQGDGACFTGKFLVPENEAKAKKRLETVKAYAPKFKLFDYTIMRFTEDEKCEGYLTIEKIMHHYSHSNTVASDNGDLTAFVRDFSNQLYRDLEAEYNDLQSNSMIRETIENNDYEFYTDNLKMA